MTFAHFISPTYRYYPNYQAISYFLRHTFFYRIAAITGRHYSYRQAWYKSYRHQLAAIIGPNICSNALKHLRYHFALNHTGKHQQAVAVHVIARCKKPRHLRGKCKQDCHVRYSPIQAHIKEHRR